MLWYTHSTVITICFLLLILTLAYPAAYSMTPGAPDSLTITEKDNRGQVQISRGGILTLKLKYTPGTGYQWQIVRNEPEPLDLLEKFEQVDKENGDKLGAYEYQIFRFRAQNSGTNILELQYVRVWEKNKVPLKTFSITVKIQ